MPKWEEKQQQQQHQWWWKTNPLESIQREGANTLVQMQWSNVMTHKQRLWSLTGGAHLLCWLVSIFSPSKSPANHLCRWQQTEMEIISKDWWPTFSDSSEKMLTQRHTIDPAIKVTESSRRKKTARSQLVSHSPVFRIPGKSNERFHQGREIKLINKWCSKSTIRKKIR